MITSPIRRFFRGATALLAGSRGLVPAPAAGAQDHVLHGDGTFRATTNASAANLAEALAGLDNSKYLTPATGNARALQGDLSRQVSDMLYFDGTTSGSRAYWLLGAAGNMATGHFTIALRLTVPAANPTAEQGVIILSKASDSYGTSVYCFAVTFDTSGRLTVGLRGGAGSSYNARFLRIANVVSRFAAQDVHLAVTFDRAAAPLVYLAGAAETANATEVTTGPGPGYPAWTEAIDSDFLVLGVLGTADRFRGRMSAPVLVNRVWSATDVLMHAATGRLPNSDAIATGSMVPALTANFSAGVDGFVGVGGVTIAGNVDGINGQDDWLSMQRTGTTGQVGASRAITNLGHSLIGGSFVLFRARIYNASATPRYFSAGFAGYSNNADGTTAATLVAAGAQADMSIIRRMRDDEIPSASPDMRILSTAANGATDSTVPVGDVFYVKNIEVVVLAPILNPVIQPVSGFGGTIRDAGSNRIDGVVTAGVRAITTVFRGCVRARLTWAGTHEGKPILADIPLLPGLNAMLESIIVQPTASSSGLGLRLGKSGANDYWVTATPLVANTRQVLTLNNRFPSANTAADLKMEIDPDSANYTGTIDVTVNYVLLY